MAALGRAVDAGAVAARLLGVVHRDVGLDDFGAGFASFYYLKHLAFDYLKIDGEFVSGIANSHTDQLVVRSLVEIARRLGKRTIAEFVGDSDSLELLREYGVDYAQGFYVGRPKPLAEVELQAPPRCPRTCPDRAQRPLSERSNSPSSYRT